VKFVRPFQEEGLLWLRATAAYELHNTAIIDDAKWDALTQTLRDNYDRLDPYLKDAIPLACLQSSTGSGVDWTQGLPKMAAEETIRE
jgi:hypothetical protein